MKKIILIAFLFYVKIFSQESNASIELYFGTENASGGGITFTVTYQSQVWGVEYPPPSNCMGWEYYKTNSFNIGEYEVTNHNQSPGFWKGLDFVSSQDNSGFYDIYGYGLYKITTSESNSHFYIDYRDQRMDILQIFGLNTMPALIHLLMAIMVDHCHFIQYQMGNI